MTTAPVFLVDQLPAGDHAVLDGPEGRHAATVRRLHPGEELMLCDGRGAVAHCVIESADRRDALDLRLLRRWAEPPPQPRIVVAQALVKGDRGELAVELATEAGADAIVPWQAARSVARWDDGPRGAKALARWRSTVREAAKQSRRTWVPDVAEPVSTAGLATLVRSSAAAFLLDSAAGARLTDAELPPRGDLLIIVGPEGGISSAESTLLEQAGAQVVRLGPTVLRASTAGVVAVSAIGVLTQRWR
ncbi:MAG TPA: 16S rRNA (uracil(1498)-N(3))-methyltransferase [Actinophytocola sp.]|uniref:16S rRNA (uracil(1498)-N(3))-methyltransferase n=1 Tax=Actinophytocola sp. TaxID=1872138 RepID=UPI002DB76CD5|nr:16S rRNA (uracil(1498)-N(3))-methyltransferase [Actinophytocola sp.]HEU5474420.1 16S rRNA (uracil(1498)-N(3))-methyltransferase [Actinophytocola sp.]